MAASPRVRNCCWGQQIHVHTREAVFDTTAGAMSQQQQVIGWHLGGRGGGLGGRIGGLGSGVGWVRGVGDLGGESGAGGWDTGRPSPFGTTTQILFPDRTPHRPMTQLHKNFLQSEPWHSMTFHPRTHTYMWLNPICDLTDTQNYLCEYHHSLPVTFPFAYLIPVLSAL